MRARARMCRLWRTGLVIGGSTVLVGGLACGDGVVGPHDGGGADGGALTEVVIPQTPDVSERRGTVGNGAREFHLRAHVFRQPLATLP